MDFEKLNYISEAKLPDPKTLVIVFFSLISFFASINGLFSDFFETTIRAVLYVVVLILWVIFWAFNRFYLPSNKKRQVGIVISIYTENEFERQKLKADFISKLKSDFQREGISEVSDIIFLKNHFSKQIVESKAPKNKIWSMNKKIKAHFYVWGDVKKRPDGDEGEKYFINFQGYVIHKPISQNLSQEISKDFSKVLPKEINFLEKRGFREFETSASIVHLAAKYIIGLAAFVSQDPILALSLHSGLRDQFNIFKPLPTHLQDIRNRIPLLISDELLWIAKLEYARNNLPEAKKYLSKSFSENNNNYGSWLLKAIIDFSNDRDTNEALVSLSKAEKYAKGSFEWRYSKAFLYFWAENYPKALKLCKKIRNQSYASEAITLNEVRNFNLNLLNSPNPKGQLYFWIGYLSYFKQSNLPIALDDFEKFEEFFDDSMAILKQQSSAYLKEIKRELGNVK